MITMNAQAVVRKKKKSVVDDQLSSQSRDQTKKQTPFMSHLQNLNKSP